MGSNLEEQRKEISPQCPGEWQWACRNGECIARYDTCDGIPQCSDGSDEWNCEQWRQKQDHGYNIAGKSGTRSVSSTQPSTATTAIAESGYVVLSTRELIVALAVFVILAVLLVLVIRRRARMKALARNRRGNLLQADSDEDDILISSMYS